LLALTVGETGEAELAGDSLGLVDDTCGSCSAAELCLDRDNPSDLSELVRENVTESLAIDDGAASATVMSSGCGAVGDGGRNEGCIRRWRR